MLASRQPGQHVGGVAVVQADVGEAAVVDRSERLRHAVDERLDPDEAGPRVALRLRHQMLAAAEAAFERARRRRRSNSARRSAGAGASRSSASFGSSVSNSAACRGLSACPLRRPKNAPWRLIMSACRVVAGSRRWPASSKTLMAGTSLPAITQKRDRYERAYLNALLSWLTRLVCSQEKPPSLSGARPKWP